MSLRRSARSLARASAAASIPEPYSTSSAEAARSRPTKAAKRASSRVVPAPEPTAPTAAVPASRDLEVVLFPDPTSFETWLSDNGSSSPGLWLKIAKKASGIPSVTYDQALDAALCHGWIDGQRRSLDDLHFLQRFTPRRPGSLWSRRNVDKVAGLVTAGRMRPRGQAEVEAARADGRWERAYASSANAQVPVDFQAALDKNKRAGDFFSALSKAQRYPFLWRIETAKKPETRRRRIEQFVELLAQNKTL